MWVAKLGRLHSEIIPKHEGLWYLLDKMKHDSAGQVWAVKPVFNESGLTVASKRDILNRNTQVGLLLISWLKFKKNEIDPSTHIK